MVAGLVVGPLIHQIAVQAGSDLPFNRRNCRRCGSPVGLVQRCPSCGLGPHRVWVTSLGSALLFGAAAWALGAGWLLVAYLFFAGMSIALFLTDIDHQRIPNRITYPGTPLAAALLAGGAVLDGRGSDLPGAFLGALAFAAFFFVVYLVARGGFGFGDVKLAVSLGLFVSFLGWDRLFLAGMATAATGGIIALVALVAGRVGARHEIPYGPPMIIGAWIAVLGGERLAGLLL